MPASTAVASAAYKRQTLVHAGARADRGWFLQNSSWHDALWTFAPTNAPEEVRAVRIRWDFVLTNAQLFTAPRYAALLESSKQLVASIRTHSLGTGLPQRAQTASIYFVLLRGLLRWMDSTGYARFSQLDAHALLQFEHYLRHRRQRRNGTLAPSTLRQYLQLFTYLYRYRDQIDDALRTHPFAHRSLQEVVGRDHPKRWPYTPDDIAVALVQGASNLVATGTASILQARDVYAAAMLAATQRGCGFDAATMAAKSALQRACIVIPGRAREIQDIDELAQLIDMLYAACFVLISYLVGARVSEILWLDAGCVQMRGEAPAAVAVIVGAIFKNQPEYHGLPHEWVSPPPAVQAIAVLEALSAGHRTQAKLPKLWLRRRAVSGASEWQTPCPGPLTIVTPFRMSWLLRRFAAWLGLPKHEGRDWRLTTHQGRKTFARFAALRDRTALFALAQHFGHRERAVTDRGYGGSDYQLNQEIDAHTLEQSAGAWEHMLTAPSLGGRTGEQIVAKRPRFRGARVKQDIKSYARMLVDAGLVLGVCDWGYCVYREEHSACLGNALGPNPARREPSTCASCKNFAVSSTHRPYWLNQQQRHEAMLNEPALPLQTLRVVRQRVNEARTLISAIDGADKTVTDGK